MTEPGTVTVGSQGGLEGPAGVDARGRGGRFEHHRWEVGHTEPRNIAGVGCGDPVEWAGLGVVGAGVTWGRRPRAPRWSVAGHSEESVTRPMAGFPGSRAMVSVGPPLLGEAGQRQPPGSVTSPVPPLKHDPSVPRL